MALSDAVAAQVLGELHVLTKNIEDQAKRVEELAATVVDAAKRVSVGKTFLHSQNEAKLMRSVNEIKEAVGKLKGMEGAMQQAARAQAETAILPLVVALKDKDIQAMKYYGAARDVYKTLSDKVNSALIILGICFSVAVGGAFYAGVKVGASSTEKTESHAGSRSFGNQK